MNILPKKRWHVRTKDNIARVRRDEAKAAEEEKRAKERIALAEQEFRTRILKQKAVDKRRDDGIILPSNNEDVTLHASDGHVNFFSDLELQERTFGSNKEYQQEKKQEKEEEERKIGVLKYLGEGSVEYMKETPWWGKPPSRPTKETAASSSSDTKTETVKQGTGAAAPSVVLEKNPRLLARKEATELKKSRKEKKKKRKYKHSRKKKQRKSPTSSSEESSDEIEVLQSREKPSLQKLREERLKREAEEKLKAERLLREVRGETAEGHKTVTPKPPIRQKYNSQFNPEIARQNQDDA